MRVQHAKIWGIAIFLAALLGGFQNCGLSIDKKMAAAQNKGLQNNGDGYTGKGTYVQPDKNNQCGDGSGVKSVIELINGRAFQTKRECSPIQPTEVSNFSWMPHNMDLLLTGAALYQERTLTENLDLGCRGRSSTADPQGRYPFADIQLIRTQVNADGNMEYKGVVKTGAYDSTGQLLYTQEAPISRAEEHLMPSGMRSYMIFTPGVYDPKSGLPPPPTPPAPPMNLSLSPANQATLLFPAPELQGLALIVPQMNCGLAE